MSAIKRPAVFIAVAFLGAAFLAWRARRQNKTTGSAGDAPLPVGADPADPSQDPTAAAQQDMPTLLSRYAGFWAFIDVSEFNWPIDEKAIVDLFAANKQLLGVMVRVGYGPGTADAHYSDICAILARNQIPFFFYFQFFLTQDPVQQATAAVNLAKPMLDLPNARGSKVMVMDVESIGKVSSARAMAALVKGLKQLIALGFTPGWYANLSTVDAMGSRSTLPAGTQILLAAWGNDAEAVRSDLVDYSDAKGQYAAISEQIAGDTNSVFVPGVGASANKLDVSVGTGDPTILGLPKWPRVS